MPPSNDPDDVDMPMTASDRPFIVTLSAQAIGSVGFGLSILAIWVLWLVPSATPDPLPTPPPPKHRRLLSSRTRHSPPSPRPHHTPVSPLPQPIITQEGSTQHATHSSKRVTFVDRPTSGHKERPADQGPQTAPKSAEPPAVSHNPILATWKEDVAEETSSDPSRLSIPKARNPFAGKRHLSPSPPREKNVHERHEPPVPPEVVSYNLKLPRTRNAGPFVPWATKNRTLPIAVVDDLVLPKVHLPRRSSFPSKFCSKSTVGPVRRTSPYEAPHFAIPPIPIGSTPYNPDVVGSKVYHRPIPEEKAESNRSSSPGELASQPQTPTNFPRRPLFCPKRRSASLDAGRG